MSLINDYREKDDQQYKVLEVPDIKFAVPQQAPVATPPVQQDVVPLQVVNDLANPNVQVGDAIPLTQEETTVVPTLNSGVEQLVQQGQQNLINDVRNDVVGANNLERAYDTSGTNTQLPTVFNTADFTSWSQNNKQFMDKLGDRPIPQVQLTPNVTIPKSPKYDPTKQAENKPWWQVGLEALNYAGNVTQGIGYDIVNSANTIGAFRDKVVESVTGDKSITSNPYYRAFTNPLGGVNIGLQKLAEPGRNNGKFELTDLIPKIDFQAGRSYSAEAVKGADMSISGTTLEEAGKKAPIGAVDKSLGDGFSNPTLWSGIGLDFATGFATGFTLEPGIARLVGKGVGLATKSSRAAGIATRAAEIGIDPIGELVLSPTINRVIIPGVRSAIKAVTPEVLGGEVARVIPTPQVETPTIDIEASGVGVKLVNAEPDIASVVKPGTQVETNVGTVTVKSVENGHLRVEGTNIKGLLPPSAIKTDLPELTVATPVKGAASFPLTSPFNRANIPIGDGLKRPTTSVRSVDSLTQQLVKEFETQQPSFKPTELPVLPPSLVPTSVPGVVTTPVSRLKFLQGQLPVLPPAKLPEVQEEITELAAKAEVVAETVDIPAVDARVFTGTMTMKDFSRVIAEQVPGTQVDAKAVVQSKRTLKDLLALGKKVVTPDGTPVFAEGTSEIRTYARLKKRLESLNLPASYHTLFEQYGAPIPTETLNNSKDFRIVFQEEVPFKQPEAAAVVSNKKVTPSFSEETFGELPKNATDVKVENGVRSYKVKPTAVPKQAPKYVRDLQKEIDTLRVREQVQRDMGQKRQADLTLKRIQDLETQLDAPKVTEPGVLESIQKDVLPVELHGKTPEVIESTQRLVDAQVELQNKSVELMQLKVAQAEIQERLELSTARTMETPDIGRKFLQEEEPKVKPNFVLDEETQTVDIYQDNRFMLFAEKTRDGYHVAFTVDGGYSRQESRPSVPVSTFREAKRAWSDFLESDLAKGANFTTEAAATTSEEYASKLNIYKRFGFNEVEGSGGLLEMRNKVNDVPTPISDKVKPVEAEVKTENDTYTLTQEDRTTLLNGDDVYLYRGDRVALRLENLKVYGYDDQTVDVTFSVDNVLVRSKTEDKPVPTQELKKARKVFSSFLEKYKDEYTFLASPESVNLDEFITKATTYQRLGFRYDPAKLNKPQLIVQSLKLVHGLDAPVLSKEELTVRFKYFGDKLKDELKKLKKVEVEPEQVVKTKEDDLVSPTSLTGASKATEEFIQEVEAREMQLSRQARTMPDETVQNFAKERLARFSQSNWKEALRKGEVTDAELIDIVGGENIVGGATLRPDPNKHGTAAAKWFAQESKKIGRAIYDMLPERQQALFRKQLGEADFKLLGIKEGSKAPANGQWFHGTRVQNIDAVDAVNGGKRAEWGTGFYVTRNPELAKGYALADVSPNLPNIEGRQFGKPSVSSFSVSQRASVLDVTEPPDDAVKFIFEDFLTSKQMKKAKTVRDLFDLVDRELVKKGADEALATETYRELSKGLRTRYDIVANDTQMNVLNTGVLRRDLTQEVAESGDVLEVAANRYNVESHRAATNPKNIQAQVDFEESSTKLQAEMLGKVEAELKDVEREHTAAISKMMQEEDALEEAARNEQLQLSSKKQQQRTQKRKRELKKLKEDNDPCQP